MFDNKRKSGYDEVIGDRQPTMGTTPASCLAERGTSATGGKGDQNEDRLRLAIGAIDAGSEYWAA